MLLYLNYDMLWSDLARNDTKINFGKYRSLFTMKCCFIQVSTCLQKMWKTSSNSAMRRDLCSLQMRWVSAVISRVHTGGGVKFYGFIPGNSLKFNNIESVGIVAEGDVG